MSKTYRHAHTKQGEHRKKRTKHHRQLQEQEKHTKLLWDMHPDWF